MFPKLIAFMIIYFLSSVCGLKGNIVFNIPEVNENQLKWPQKKIDTIEYLLSVLTEVGNVTLVGWQRIYDVDGSLMQIRTIELTILSEVHPEQSLDTEDVAVYWEAAASEEMLNEASTLTGIICSASFHQWDRDGSLADFLEVQPNSIKVYYSPYKFMHWKRKATVAYDKTMKLTLPLLEKLQRQSPLSVAGLHWNVDGKLKDHVIVPLHLATVLLAEQANITLAESAMYAVAKGSTDFKYDMYNYVTHYMTKKFPEYLWIATPSAYNSWVHHEVYLQLGYTDDILYRNEIHIFGVKK